MLNVTKKMLEECKILRESKKTYFSYPVANGYIEGYTSNHDTVGVMLTDKQGSLKYKDFVIVDGYDYPGEDKDERDKSIF